jgi:hypothetical protein
MRGIGQAEAEVARRNVQTLDRQQQATQEIFKQHETEMASLNKHREEMINAIKEQKIDPKHFLSSQSAPQKVATAIGLILGGLSSGLTGKDNPALTFLNHQIDRDIEGQRMEMSRKHNLLGSLEKQIGDTKLAQATARAMLADKYANEMLSNAEKSKDKMAEHNMGILQVWLTLSVLPDLARVTYQQRISQNECVISKTSPLVSRELKKPTR